MASSTPTNQGPGLLSQIGPLLAMLVDSPLLATQQIKFDVNGRRVDARPILRQAAVDLADGRLDPAEIQALVLQAVTAILTAPRIEHHEAIAASPGVVGVAPVFQPAPVVLPLPAAIGANVLVDEIRFEGLHFEGDRHGGSAGEIITDPNHVQMKGERAKFNWTGYRNGVKVPDEVIRTLYMPDGHSPWAQPRWGYLRPDGSEEMHWNSTDHVDAFELQGYDKASGPNAGFTFVLLLEEQRGPGQGTAFARLELPAAANGGVPVKSNSRATWQTD
jgi:hypothetical protein